MLMKKFLVFGVIFLIIATSFAIVLNVGFHGVSGIVKITSSLIGIVLVISLVPSQAKRP